MQILIAHNDYGAPSGEEHALEEIERFLVGQGHEIKWFRSTSAGIGGLSTKTVAFFAGIHNPRACERLRHSIAGLHPDVVMVQNLYPFLSPSILGVCRRAGVPVVMRCPNYRLLCPNGLHLSHGEICERCLGGREYWCVLRNCEQSFFKSLGYAARNFAARVTRRILDNVDVFIVLSEFQRRRFIAGGIPETRIRILPNMAPQIAVPIEGSGEGVTFVGRISAEKGIADFIEAARLLSSLPFQVAGNADVMPELVRKSPGNVRWLGFLKGTELDRCVAGSRLLVFPSRCYEGFPNVVTHAMTCGRPVVAARLGVLPEIVAENQTGLLFNPGDVTDLARCIRELYEDPTRAEAMGKAGRARALSRYSPAIVGQRLIDILESAVQMNG